MQIEQILRHKGTKIISVSPTSLLSDAAEVLEKHRIGAVLVCDQAGAVIGILSERDIVRGLAQFGCDCLSGPVESLMTADVLTCEPSDTIDQVMALMTEKRIRHLPVMSNGKLTGVISIGDVVKTRIEEVEYEADAMRQYIATG
jgi:CBS domain-containing protein